MKTRILKISVCCLSLFLMICPIAKPQQRQAPSIKPYSPTPAYLNGLAGMHVEVLIPAGHKEKDFSEKELRQHIEEQLRKAGIPVLKGKGETAMLGQPRLQVEIMVFESSNCGAIYKVQMKVIREVLLTKDSSTKIEAATWESGTAMGQTTEDGKSIPSLGITQAVGDILKGFISAYKYANQN